MFLLFSAPASGRVRPGTHLLSYLPTAPGANAPRNGRSPMSGAAYEGLRRVRPRLPARAGLGGVADLAAAAGDHRPATAVRARGPGRFSADVHGGYHGPRTGLRLPR